MRRPTNGTAILHYGTLSPLRHVPRSDNEICDRDGMLEVREGVQRQRNNDKDMLFLSSENRNVQRDNGMSETISR